MPTRLCAGPTPGQPCPNRALVPAAHGAKTASRCPPCQRIWQRAKDQRRPERRTWHEQERRRQVVEEWVVLHGWWCPGIPGQQPPHPSHDLTAEHITAVAISHDEGGPLTVLCRPCNSKLGARLAQH